MKTASLKPIRNFLIYTSAGRAANIRQWYATTQREYDIWVTNFTTIPSLNQKYSDFYNEHEGSKWQNLKFIFQEHRDLLSKYKAIMVLDDDIIISPKALTALFHILISRDLWILQPAFSRFGKISHKITRRKPFSNLRYTNFIEVGCPIFRTDKLLDFLSVYRPELSLCFGLDWWFSYHFGIDVQDRYAISDKYYCINPRDILKMGGSREIDKLCSEQERNFMWERIKRETGIKQFEKKDYREIEKSIIESIGSVPMFTMEVLFDETWSLLLRMRRLFRSMKSQT
jgi:hypothetical protein